MIYYINAQTIDLHKESNMRHLRFFIIRINHKRCHLKEF